MHAPRFTRRALLGVGIGIGLSAALLAPSGPATAASVNVSASGVAIEGHDPVAYFTMNEPVPGDPAITATHEGAVYRFSSEQNRTLFEADPAKYAPQYGGYCAYGAAKGYKAPVEVDKFSIVDGKLYLNYNGQVQGTWIKDTAGYIEKADAWWKRQ
ncbi:MAG: YHS domain-containing (seleno)protein [Hoeflea sp.]|uniref:YHS domain-containing (seleno)protein n=1 Tax=Hoeflea sp. TaxID=1940281 RepID=UPI0032EE9FF2